jgi:parallel beta-helix repeat protein
MATILFVVVSVVLMGGQSDAGLRWWRTHEPIYIAGDDAFTLNNGVVSGSGTHEDPYIIEGWYIDACHTDYGIYVDHTQAHFVIRGCVIEKAGDAGIYLNTVTNGSIEKCQISLSKAGVRFLNASGNQLTESVIANNNYGVVMMLGSRQNSIYGNSFINNGSNALDRGCLNSWFGETGNYWSDYAGTDQDGDGIGDRAYHRLYDPQPVMEPPVDFMGVASVVPGTAGRPVSQSGDIVITSQMQIALTSTDPGSGVDKILYSINGGNWEEYTGPFNLSGPDGEYVILYYGVDKLGNAEPSSKLRFVLDNHPPETAISFGKPTFTDEIGTWLTSRTLVTLDLVSASTYGEPKTFYAIDGGPWRRYLCPFYITGPDGPHQISYYSTNASGTNEEVHVTTVLKDDTPPVTQQGQPTNQEGPQSDATEASTSVVPTPQAQSNAAVTTPQPEASAVVHVTTEPAVETFSETIETDIDSSEPSDASPAATQTPSTTD